ncbi:CesT family type III secretion system chaperone [Variovorax soli]|uniref:CesT family type III secretion system chaperone n=1 Tax=Variovorax soli TaxID=376815 RepID=UPI0008384FE8|nr:CesT family type III secretion system chaperone [Variovorax soli]
MEEDEPPDEPFERYAALVLELCAALGIPDPNAVLRSRRLEFAGFDVLLDYFPDDPAAMYMLFDYGAATAGRSLPVFRLMLESNLLIYAQDQAQLGLDPDTGNVLLIVRIPLDGEVTGEWLFDTVDHYAEHGKYWRENLIRSPDEIFEGLGQGQYTWIRA